MIRIYVAVALLALRLRVAELRKPAAPAKPAYVGRHWAPGVLA
jgi:hypothetical protein